MSNPRTVASTSAFIIVVLLLPVMCLTQWMQRSLLDSDGYVDTIAPLSSDPAIQSAVADRATHAVMAGIDIDQRAQDLVASGGDRTKALVPIIVGGIEFSIRHFAETAVRSEQFSAVWTEMNRYAHIQVSSILSGRDGRAVTTADGVVTLDLVPLIDLIVAQLEARFSWEIGDTLRDRLLESGSSTTKFVLLESELLASMQRAVHIVNQLTSLIAVVVLCGAVVCIVTARNRRMAGMTLGFGAFWSMALTWLMLALTRDVYAGTLPQEMSHSAALSVFDIVTRSLSRTVGVVAVVALVVASTLWAIGRRSSDDELQFGPDFRNLDHAQV